MADDLFRTCSKCGEIKSIDQFHKRKLLKSGVRGICKECRKKHEKRYPDNKELKRAYYQNNYEAYEMRRKNYWKSLMGSVRIRLGNKCARCGFSDERALQIDHINGGGNIQRKELSNYMFLKHLLELPDKELFINYQLLCANCNIIKKIENKEFRKREV